MKELTLDYVIENNFSASDCIKYFKPEWNDAFPKRKRKSKKRDRTTTYYNTN